MAKDPLIVWSKLNDCSSGRTPLCTIEQDLFCKMYVRAVENFFRASPAGLKILYFEINHTHGIGDVPKWRDISAKLTDEHISWLQEKGLAQPTLDLVRQNLDIEGAAIHFHDMAKKYGANEAEICSALEFASKSHACQSFARPQDSQGLYHIPYVQHPINVALNVMKLSMPASAVIKALLHDVIEDTDVDSASLAKRFDTGIASGVGELTKPANQSREDFLIHVKGLRGEAAVIKGLDRYDNLIRAFSINDPNYHHRILSECTAVYDDIFTREPELQTFCAQYEFLKQELRYFSSCVLHGIHG